MQVVTKTVNQQRNYRGYQALVQGFADSYKEKKKNAEALKKKKIGKLQR